MAAKGGHTDTLGYFNNNETDINIRDGSSVSLQTLSCIVLLISMHLREKALCLLFNYLGQHAFNPWVISPCHISSDVHCAENIVSAQVLHQQKG